MAGRTITARELARLIGVSQSAVSRAFTPGASISDEMRSRILASAARYGYSPNAIAKSLSRRRSDIVGLVISDLRNPFYTQLLETLSNRLQQTGLQSLLFNVAPGSDVRQQLVALRQYNIDALIVVSATRIAAPDLARIAEGRRAVLVNRVLPESGITSVSCDNAAGARAIADHFHALGHRRTAFVGGLPTAVNAERRNAFVTRLAEHGMTLTAAVSAGEYSHEGGYKAALAVLAGGRARPTAIFFANDILALGGIDAIRHEAGLSVPGDVSVAGFDDIAMARWPRYDLTTYRQPLDDIVDAAIDSVSRPLPADVPRPARLIAGSLVARGTTGRPPATPCSG